MLDLNLLIEIARPYYDRPRRAYHNWGHVEFCLAELEGLMLMDDRALRAAILFHDAIYDPRASDNEARSAELAKQVLETLGCTEDFVGEVEGLILDTRHAGEPMTQNGMLMVDIDLCILGQSAEVYAQYAAGIREEYAFVTLVEYVVGRGRFLEKLLGKPRIYYTEQFQERYELAARENIRRELTDLGRGSGLSDSASI